MRRNLAAEAEGPRLVAPLAALAGELQAAVGRSAGVLELAGEEIRLAELQDTERMEVPDPRRFVSRLGLPQE